MEHDIIPLLAIFMTFMVPIMAIFMAMLSVYLSYRKRKEMFALYHQERMAAIEKGIELPPLPDHFFQENHHSSRRSPHKTLLAGLVLLFGGLTTSLALHLAGVRTDSGADTAVYGLIPAGIGVAFLIYYFTVGRKVAAALEEERKSKLAEAARIQNLSA